MAIYEVVKNVYTFASVLARANTSAVKQWDMRSLNNALNWAKYCMKVEEETRSKSYRTDLDRHVQSLTILLDPVSLLHLDLCKLQDATGILCKLLLQNPDTPDTLVNALHKTVQEGCKEYEVNHSRRGTCDSTLYQLLGEDVLPGEASCQDQAEYVMQRLVNLKKLTLSSAHRYERFLDKFLLALMTKKEGVVVVLHLLLKDVTSEEDYSCITSIKHKVLKVLHSDETGLHSVWNCDRELLHAVASDEAEFCDMYMTFLTSWAESMYPKYGMTENGELYQWRYQNEDKNHEFSKENLVGHFSAMLSSNRRLKYKLESLIAEKTQTSYFSIWKDIQKCLSLRTCDRNSTRF